MARGWKRGVEWLAARSGLTDLVARGKRPCTAILAYHNIVPRGESVCGDVSLHVDQDAFARQLDFILERYEVISLEEMIWGDGDAHETSRVVITFDDAYQGALTAGVDELRARGLPATIFVPPGLLGSEAFWWDALSPSEGGPLSPTLRTHALGALEGRQDPIMKWAAGAHMRVTELPTHARPSSEEALVESASYEGLTLGAHTWSHLNLAGVGRDEVHSELSRSKAWLRERAPRYTDWLAYPYGLRTGDTVSVATELFRGALLIEGGLAGEQGQPTATAHEAPRVNVPRGLTLEGLGIRLAGLGQ